MAGDSPSPVSMNLNLNQLLPSSGSGSGTQRGRSSSLQTERLIFDPEAKSALDRALAEGGAYSKDAAISDAKSLSELTMQRLLESQMPGLASAGKRSGGYNSTTQAMLTNDLAARTGAAGAGTLLDSITKYAQIRQGNIQVATGAVSATTAKEVATQQEQSSETTSSTNSPGQIQDILGGKGLGDTVTGVGKKIAGYNPITAPLGGGGTVICTQLYQDGVISTSAYRADTRYARNNFSAATQNGYRFYAVPFVSLMRKKSWAYSVGKFIGIRWSQHCAAYFNPKLKDNLTGYLLAIVVVPICYITGLLIAEVSYKQLWAKE